MKLDILTLAFVSCLTFLTQCIALSIQYKVSRTYRGGGWWLLGSACMALGVIFMPMVNIKSLQVLAMISNPLTIAGHIFLYIGVSRFYDAKENRLVLISIFLAFLFPYYYFIFFENSISSRGIVLASAMALMSFVTGLRLAHNKGQVFSVSANLTALVFFVYGCFCAVRVWAIISSPPIQYYTDQKEFLELSFLVPIVVSLLWTFGFIILVNQRLNEENREEKEKLQLIFNTSPDAAVISRLRDGSIVDVNAGFLTMSGYTREELIENTTIQINIWHQAEDRGKFIADLQEKGSCENQEYVFQRKDGSLIYGSISANILSLKNTPHIISIIHDITKNKQSEDAVRESEELYRSILNASPDDITITDLNGSILVISPAAKKIFGYEVDYDRFIGTHLLDYIVPEDRDRAKANILRMWKGEYGGPNEYLGVRKDSSHINIEVNSGLIHNAIGQPAKMVFVVRDVTERKQAEQKIQQLVQQLEIEKQIAQDNAITDILTGLANRRYFDGAISAEFHRTKRSGGTLSVIMMDVDHFKNFNDHYGHLAGDECLRQIGATLNIIFCRATDIVARYGGEEFVAVLTDVDPLSVKNLAERIRSQVELLRLPNAGSNVSEFVTISLGVVTTSTTSMTGPEEVVMLADKALYSAKDAGRNQVYVGIINDTRLG